MTASGDVQLPIIISPTDNIPMPVPDPESLDYWRKMVSRTAKRGWNLHKGFLLLMGEMLWEHLENDDQLCAIQQAIAEHLNMPVDTVYIGIERYDEDPEPRRFVVTLLT